MNDITLFICPNCSNPLVHKAAHKEMVCSTCDAVFRIDAYGIARLAQSDFYYREVPRESLRKVLEGVSRKDILDRFDRLIGECKQESARFYALDSRRAGGVFLLDLDKDSVVLDYGAGWGTITQNLSALCRQVVSVDLTYESLEFSARVYDSNNVFYAHAGDTGRLPFKNHAFDAIILNGVLEWIPEGAYLEQDPRDVQRNFLSEIQRVLRPGGQVYIGIENRFGYRYFTGVKEDHTGLRFGALLPRFLANSYSQKIRKRPYRTYTYSYSGYRRLLEGEGFQSKIFHPWLDYRRFDEILTQQMTKRYYQRERSYRSLKNRINESAVDIFSWCGLLHLFTPSFAVIGTQRRADSDNYDQENASVLEQILQRHQETLDNTREIHISSTQSLLIKTVHHFYKIAMTELSCTRLMAADHAHRLLVELYPGLCQFAAIQDIRLHRHGKVTYLVDNILEPVAHSSTQIEIWLQSYFESVLAYTNLGQLHLNERFADVYNFIESDSVLHRNVEKAIICLEEQTWLLGPTHGDLHSGNMLCQSAGKTALIDWDRFEEKGPVIIDVLHYRTQKYMSERRASWLDAIRYIADEINEKARPAQYFEDVYLDKYAMDLYVLDKIQKDLSGVPHPAYLPATWQEQAKRALYWIGKEG